MKAWMKHVLLCLILIAPCVICEAMGVQVGLIAGMSLLVLMVIGVVIDRKSVV